MSIQFIMTIIIIFTILLTNAGVFLFGRLYVKDKVRALYVILQNPVFAAQSSYTVLAHVLRHITALPNSDHQMLVHWFRT